ncbi:MAG TPA: VOC family protein [Herpetosiphonaceae bacterium]|nr:VOC family protein [Herpetosiphonaceae bacterium]
MNPFGHMDIRVASLERCLPFYERLLPALGFARTFHSADWRVFAAEGDLPAAAYVALTEDAAHRPGANCVGFWAPDPAAVDRLATLVAESGGAISDGPRRFPFSPSYYAVFFADPCGNQYEYTYRVD